MGGDFNFSRGAKRGRLERNASINVTPLVDVMLVLLIVFMVSAPLLTVGVPLDLPKADAPGVLDVQSPITLSLDAEGQLFMGGEGPLEQQALIPLLEAATDGDTSRKIYLRGDQQLQYSRLVALLAELANAGYSALSLVAEPEG